MSELKYPGDLNYEESLTAEFLTGMEAFKERDDLNFLDAIPYVCSENWNKNILIWSGRKADNKMEQTIQCKNFGFSTPISQQLYADYNINNQENDIKKSVIRNVIVELVTNIHKQQFYNAFLKPGLFNPLKPEKEWHIKDLDDSRYQAEPIKDVEIWCDQIKEKTDLRPNCAFVSHAVFKFLCTQKQIGLTNRSLKCQNTRDKLATSLGLDRIYTIGRYFLDDNRKYIDCNSFLLCHISNYGKKIDVGELLPTAIVKIIWSDLHGGENKFNTRILEWEDIRRRSIILDSDIVFGLKIATQELGGIYTPVNGIND